MTQMVSYWSGETEFRRELPDPDEHVMPGIRWGAHWNLFTPAYWVSQLWMGGLDTQSNSPYKAMGTIEEELVFCMLGGFGITVELATAAFNACRDAGLIDELNVSAADWSEILLQPVLVEGRLVHYRYPNQKAIYLADAMKFMRSGDIDLDGGRKLRDSLLQVKGVGPKTAGWVARNFLDADDVAILDIHIIRAGLLCDLFAPSQKVERDYFEMESQYIQLSGAMKVRPAVLDCLIWDQMRTVGKLAVDAVRYKLEGPSATSVRAPAQEQLQLSLIH
nr:hypothetical protein [uncultured Rhodoferax sp.]